MPRVQFVETVTVPLGISGSLLPLAGVVAIPYVVDINGNEGGQANAYAGRQGNLAAPTNNTDASGTISFWLDAGDYNIHFQDQQTPPRIQSYVRGFTAPVINTDQIVVAAQNLIQFTGDLKYSLQASDHGLKSDGSYEWLLVTSDVDGGGRQIDAAIYAALRAELGNPAITSGKFRLPNISGRSLMASGAASGLTVRNLNDIVGAETITLTSTQSGVNPNGSTNGVNTNHNHAGSGTTGTDSPDHVHQETVYVNNIPITQSGGQGAAVLGGPGGYTAGANVRHAHPFGFTTDYVSDQDPGNTWNWSHGHVLNGRNADAAHSNVHPVYVGNLFVKT